MKEAYFPSDKTEYYHYFQIGNIEKAKFIYNNCNGFVFNTKECMRLIVDAMKKNNVIRSIETYQKLYEDFNKYADILIEGKDIDSIDTYNKYIHLLMIIVNETIDFTEHIIYHCRKDLKKLKFEIDGKQFYISKLLKDNLKIPFYINYDDSVNAFINNYGRIIIDFLMIFTIIFASLITQKAILSFEVSALGIIEIASAVAFDIFALYMVVRWLLSIRLFNLTDTMNQVYKRNYELINHPFDCNKKKKYNLLKYIELMINILKKK